ncbi:sensor histidine kinase, partial [Streptomyces sp. NRRL B-12105]
MATQYGQGYGAGYEQGPGQGYGAGYGQGSGERERRHRLPAGLRAPFEGRSLREFSYLMLSLPLSIIMFTLAVTMVSLGAGLLVTFVGVPLLAATLATCRGFGTLERARARALLGLDVGEPEPLRPRERGVLAWTGAMFRSGSSWRHLLYALLHLPWAVFAFAVALSFWAYGWAMLTYPLWFWVFPMWAGQGGIQLFGDESHRIYLDNPFEITVTALVGLLSTMATPWIVRGLTTVDRVLVHGLLGPSRLSARVVELESDRGVVVDAAAADLRRIERDLHDGAQARLVALAMDLGLAKEKVTEDPRAAARMVEEAHGEVKTALQELRDLARGIHPAVLTDRGLDAALSAVASRCTVPVRVEVELPARPAPAIEGIAYFTVCELLQNVSKHSGARRAVVDVWRVADRLMVQVEDDGVGGADA